jgi:Zn-dependent protease/CBS domain-containing protein
MDKSFTIGKALGIEIKIHYSWFLIFILVTWSLAEYYFPVTNAGWGRFAYWWIGGISALLLFISVLLHELSHSYFGGREGIKVKSITLFVFGGVAEMINEPQKPSVEFKMAIAGPTASLFLAGFFWIIWQCSPNIYIGALSKYLYLVNGILALFNLIPAFPLDGGRIFRSALWLKYDNLRKATEKAVTVSKVCAFLLILWGFSMLLKQNFVSGLWVIILSWFLLQTAEASLRHQRIEEILARVKISEIMNRDFVSVDPKINLTKLAGMFLDYKQGGFPVVQNQKLVGMVTLEDLREIPREKWPKVKVQEIMTKFKDLQVVELKSNAYEAFLKMTNHDVGRLPVVDNGKIVGLVTRNSIILLLAIKCERCI